jgi:hypothetical protein
MRVTAIRISTTIAGAAAAGMFNLYLPENQSNP